MRTITPPFAFSGHVEAKVHPACMVPACRWAPADWLAQFSECNFYNILSAIIMMIVIVIAINKNITFSDRLRFETALVRQPSSLTGLSSSTENSSFHIANEFHWIETHTWIDENKKKIDKHICQRCTRHTLQFPMMSHLKLSSPSTFVNAVCVCVTLWRT